jgi:hypothetical protein
VKPSRASVEVESASALCRSRAQRIVLCSAPRSEREMRAARRPTRAAHGDGLRPSAIRRLRRVPNTACSVMQKSQWRGHEQKYACLLCASRANLCMCRKTGVFEVSNQVVMMVPSIAQKLMPSSDRIYKYAILFVASRPSIYPDHL